MQRTIILAFLFLAACGKRSKSNVSDDPSTPADYCRALEDAFAKWNRECSISNPALEADTAGNAQVACASLATAVASGRQDFFADRARRCIDAISNAPCQGFAKTLWGGACDGVTAPKVELGGQCFESLDCRSGLCNAAPGACPGQCQPTAGVGEACDFPDKQCGLGLTCDLSINACKKETPPPFLPAGSACDPLEFLQCDAGLYCDNAQKQCLAQRTTGACGSEAECVDLYTCAHASGAAQGECVSVKRAGEACRPGYRECGEGYYCGVGSTCVSWSSAGGPCGPATGSEDASCLGSYCDTSGTCQPLKRVGESCASFAECARGADCSPDGKCVASCVEQ